MWEANGAFQKLELAGHTGHFENEILVFKDCNFQIPNLFEILFLPFLYYLKSSLKLMQDLMRNPINNHNNRNNSILVCPQGVARASC